MGKEGRVVANQLALLKRKLDSIGDLGEEESRLIDQLPYRLKELARGEEVAREGERATSSCVLLAGFMHRYKLVPNGGRQILALHTPGDIPDLHSLHVNLMDHTLAATVPSVIGIIEHQDLRDATTKSPGLAALLWRDTLIDAAIFREWITVMGRQSAVRHLAHLLCELFLRMQAVSLSRANACQLPLTQQVIADALGLSAVHTNRSLQSMRAEGLIEFEDYQLVIRNWDGLTQLAQFDPLYLHFKDTTYASMRA
jgi:CRP-like cAMP-binding protein